MKANLIPIYFSALALGLLVFLNSCTEDEDPAVTIDEETLIDEAIADEAWDDIDYEVQRVMNFDDGGRELGGSGERQNDPCATVTRDRETKTVTVDYGTENCEGLDGRFRRGKIVISYTGSFRKSNATQTVTFEDYFVNDRKVEGSRAITNLGPNEEGYLQQQITLTNGKLTLTDGRKITRQATWIRTWVRGNNPQEDEYLITGSASGINRNGTTWQVEVTKALVKKRACYSDRVPFPVEGIRSYSLEKTDGSTSAIVLDYGNGDCDNLALVTKDGRGPFEIELKRK